ncbi:MAG: ribbon-helix-helix protein, CopG family [Candidatus Binatia bacterium]
MPHPTTIRLSDDLLRKIDRRARARGVDRATCLRNL